MGTTPVQLNLTPTPPASRSARIDERRKSNRVPRRAVVTALVLDDAQLRTSSCLMTVISATGALIHSTEELGRGELYLHILMAGLQGRFIRAEIAHEQVDKSRRIRERRRSDRYHYGVRFVAFVTDPERLDLLRCVLSSELAALHGCRTTAAAPDS